MADAAKITVTGVTKVYRRDELEVTALQNVDFSIREGQFVSIIGPSGCGKTTLFNIIAGLTLPTSGQVVVDGRSILGQAGYVGYMLQNDLLLPWRTVLNNIILGLEIHRVPREQSVRQAMPLIERYGLKGFDQHYPSELSGGMRQRAALLRTLLYNRDILLLDEPFGALDAQTRLDMQMWLMTLWQDFSKTVLFITHDIDEAIFLSDEVFVFSAPPGRIKARIPIDLSRPRTPEQMATPEFSAIKRQLLGLLVTAGHSGSLSPTDAGCEAQARGEVRDDWVR
ncbi:MAG TPA: ABC transporter ATP-binding protein [Candidatus Limiplasma sp.]|nr:ABC transporter ATP-binding protein [Candidatus Limiplasma sp.]HPS82019.1 ABC transporter ATP-binding protein [Candidatus Limiplasma sp.]